MLIELLQVMSAFYARSAWKFIELVLWCLDWFGEESEVHIVVEAWSRIVRWQGYPPVYQSRLEDRKACRKRRKSCRRPAWRKQTSPVEGKRPVEGVFVESTESVEGSQLRLFIPS